MAEEHLEAAASGQAEGWFEQRNMNGYSLMILFFSLLNADVLVKGEKLSNKVLDVLAKANCVLFFAWALANIVYLLVK